jgi:carboxyl-terminal processing protease
MKIYRKTAGIILACILILSFATSGAYYLGFKTGLEQTKNIVIKNVTDTDAPEDVKINFSLFWEAWSKLKEKHIKGTEIDERTLLYGAINGITNAFDDPNTTFFEPDEAKKFNEDISGNFSGLGAEIGIREGRLLIISPLKDSPAEKAGLQPGDYITKIGGESTNGITVEEAAKKLRGEPGTKIVLTILKEESGEEKDIEITREPIQIPTVEWDMIDGNIIHLRIFSFNANTPTAFQKAMISSLLDNGKGMILDLRNNPGGLLDVAVDIAGWFLDRGSIVVTERFTSGEEKPFRASGNEALKDFPVVILINKGSASASEILAGALSVYKDTKLIGEKSFGKGTVQSLEELSDGSTLKITIANWLLPDGTIIEGNGLEPDFQIQISQEEIEAGKDPQLNKAIEILKQEL